MEIVTTIDGKTIELRPCPEWCTGRHFGPDEAIHSSDGFWHYGPSTVIKVPDPASMDPAATASVEASLQAWVCPLEAEPGPAQIGLTIRDTADPSVNLTPAEARLIAEAVGDLARRSEESATE